MKKSILSLAIIFATSSFGSAGDGSASITSAGDGSASITSAGDGSASITSAGDGSASITSIGNIQFIQLGNGFVRSCFQIRNKTTACTISKQ